MSKINTVAAVESFCNKNVETVNCLNPRIETYNYQVESIVNSLIQEHGILFKRSTVERYIRNWKARKRLSLTQNVVG